MTDPILPERLVVESRIEEITRELKKLKRVLRIILDDEADGAGTEKDTK